ncbi:MAG TPA: sigma 54-interacting transcriptional regulator [Myxococcales bacterium]|nr:sigma 54-interacting transcriptional regulator [Myxococcales bacterium]
MKRSGSETSGSETELVEPEGGPHALAQGFRLEVVEGPDQGKAVDARAGRTAIGSDPQADLALSDRAVSRFHCELRAGGDRVSVRDLDSTNGTRVNGVQVVEALLRDGDALEVGRSRVRFSAGAARVKIPLSERERFGVMVGRSQAMRAAFAVLERAAATDATVLLEGETGTGKEAAAESLHRESARRDGPFVVVDCGAVPGQLLESELFGHERGSFTGATASRTGAFEEAASGTAFLDEIGELPPELQPKLLRALERREVKRVGGSRYQPIDFRVIAATNRNLRAEVNAGRFRADLYYRLAVVEARLPPLRERREDLPLLVENLLAALGAADRDEAAFLRTREFAAELSRHAWPGNVRELRNYVEACLAMREVRPLPAAAAAQDVSVDTSRPLKEQREMWVQTFERAYLERILSEHQGNVSAAARAAGVDRIHFYRLLWRHGLK